MRRPHWWLVALLAAAAVPGSARAQDSDGNLADLSVEQVAGIRIGLASGRLQPSSHAATTRCGVTREAMRRAGAGMRGAALRLAPGLRVGRVPGRDWSITSRGFGERSPSKMLVLMDGGPVYSPVFACV